MMHQPLNEVSNARRNKARTAAAGGGLGALKQQRQEGQTTPGRWGQSTTTPQRHVATDNSIADPPTAGKILGTPQQNNHLNHTPQTVHKPEPVPQELFESRYLLPAVDPADAPLLTVVLDLDETLVSNRDPNLPAAILRPYAIQALEALRAIPRCEVVLWTASTEDTAEPVVHQLGATGFKFDTVICRSPLWFTEPIHSKDLRLLGRPMEGVVVFDNAPQCCKLNKGNSVLVDDFFGHSGPEDCTLYNLVTTVGHLIREAVAGKAVPEALHSCALQGKQLGMVRYQMPEHWRGDLATTPPLQVPVHGDFYKVHWHQFQ